MLASQLAGALHAGRTFSYYADFETAVAQLTPDDVKAAMTRYLVPKELATIMAGDFQKK
jgi:predicted Zn-dependent peptidase